MDMARNTLLPNVARAMFRVERDPVQQHPSPASGEGRPPPARLADTVNFFVSSATTYAAPTPAHPQSGVGGPFAALSRNLEELVSPQYQAKNPDIGAAPHGAAASSPDARRELSTPAALISPTFLLAGVAPVGRSLSSQGSVAQDRTAEWYQVAYLQYRLSHAVIDPDAQPTRPATTSIASHPAWLGPGIPIHILPLIHQRIAQQKSQSSLMPVNESLAEHLAQAADRSGKPHGAGVVTALLPLPRADAVPPPRARRDRSHGTSRCCRTPSHASRLPAITEELST